MKQFSIPVNYRSPLITSIKKKRRESDKLKKDLKPTELDFGRLKIFLARHFGFCYGVENAIEIAFDTVANNPDKRIYLLSEMIHNPFVNQDLMERGVKFLMDTKGNILIPFESLKAEDIVMIPAFGTTLDIEKKLQDIGIQIEKYNTTCPFVEKVWNRSEQIAQKGFTIVIHGKPTHEETRATFSHSEANAPAIVVNDMAEAKILGEYILGIRDFTSFDTHFKGRYSAGFDPQIDLTRIGVVNQTTMLATDTQAIADHLKNVMKTRYGLNDANIAEHFADTRDTLCYATNDNQSAVISMLEQDADLAIVIGGRKSSNSSHLVELCEHKLPTYFIESADDIISNKLIKGYNWQTNQEYNKEDYLPNKDNIRILITSGASCPDAIVETVIQKLSSYYTESSRLEEIKASWA